VFGPNVNRAGEASGEWIRAWQELRQDEIPQPMCDESVLGVTDEGVQVERNAAQHLEYAGAVEATEPVPEHVGGERRGHCRGNRRGKVHPTRAGQGTGSDQHRQGRGRRSRLGGE
jgi:hypothetical protein